MQLPLQISNCAELKMAPMSGTRALTGQCKSLFGSYTFAYMLNMFISRTRTKLDEQEGPN